MNRNIYYAIWPTFMVFYIIWHVYVFTQSALLSKLGHFGFGEYTCEVYAETLAKTRDTWPMCFIFIACA